MPEARGPWHMRVAQRLVHVGSWEIDLETTELIWSEEMFRIHGVDPRSFTPDAENTMALVHADDRERVVSTVQEIASGRDVTHDVEYRIVRPDGDVRHFRMQAAAERDGQGRPVRVLGACMDVTAERQRMRRHDETMRLLEETQRIAEIGTWEWTAGEDHLIWSDQTYRLFGLEPSEGPVPLEVYRGMVHTGDRARLDEVFRRVARGGGEITTEHRIVRVDGEVRHLRGRALAELGPDGRLVRITGTAQDITELQQVEEQLRQAQKMEAIGRLAGGVAHDFNNLITVIQSFATFVRETLSESDPARADLDEVLKAATRAAGLTRQLLEFSRRQPIQPTLLDLNELVRGADQMLARLVGEDVEIETHLTENLPRVHADAGSIEQVLVNLVVNARDAMPQGGTLTVETQDVVLDERYAEDRGFELAAGGRYVGLSVKDTGVGMTADVLEYIFEPFYTTKPVGVGTGLGLATCFGIVEQAGGHIDVHSEPGVGTTFRVYLPHADRAAVAAVVSKPAPAALSGDETILLVEDEEAVRRLAARILEKAGYNVLVASHPGEALLLAEGHGGPIHLLLSDVVMPLMRGPALAERMRHLRPGLPALFMSGYTDPVVLGRETLPGDVPLLQKPFSPEQLCRRVRAALDD